MAYIDLDMDINFVFVDVIVHFLEPKVYLQIRHLEHVKGGFGVKMEVINKKNIVKHRQKKAPYTKIQRKERRDEVYRPHFDTGMSATRIAEMMKVDRNTINDLKILYRKAIKEYNPDMTLDDIVEKQLLRLETQRDRLG